MAYNGSCDTLRLTALAGALAKTTTSQYKVAVGDYTSTDNHLYVAPLLTVGIANPVIGIIDSFQTSNSEVVSVITFGRATARAYTATATFTAGDVLCYQTEATVMPYDATGLSSWIVGYALQMGYSHTLTEIFVKPSFRGAGLIT